MAYGTVNVGQAQTDDSKYLTTEQVGTPSGLATLDANGKLTASQRPDVDAYTRKQTDDLVDQDVAAHNENASAHGDIRASIAAVDAAVKAIELKYGTEITKKSVQRRLHRPECGQRDRRMERIAGQDRVLMAEEIIFSRPADEISCIIGNLFSAITPPCDLRRSTDLVICGMTHAQNYGTLTVKSDCCIFIGEPEDLAAVLNGQCLERKCRHGR